MAAEAVARGRRLLRPVLRRSRLPRRPRTI